MYGVQREIVERKRVADNKRFGVEACRPCISPRLGVAARATHVHNEPGLDSLSRKALFIPGGYTFSRSLRQRGNESFYFFASLSVGRSIGTFVRSRAKRRDVRQRVLARFYYRRYADEKSADAVNGYRAVSRHGVLCARNNKSAGIVDTPDARSLPQLERERPPLPT